MCKFCITAVYCSFPPSIPNGYVLNATTLFHGGEALYTCFEGFSLSSQGPITCEDTGQWAAPPMCTGIWKSSALKVTLKNIAHFLSWPRVQ